MIGTREKSLSPTPSPLMSEGMKIGVVHHRALRDRRGIGSGAPGLDRLQEGFPLSSDGHCVDAPDGVLAPTDGFAQVGRTIRDHRSLSPKLPESHVIGSP